MLTNNQVPTHQDSPIELVLSTWFIKYLQGDRPGGLPNDFLSRGASSLFIFDKIICDKDALEGEEEYEGRWLSSDLFIRLKQAGLLKPVDMSEFIQETLSHVDNMGWTQRALDVMEAERDAIRKGEKKPAGLTLPPFLTGLNHYMFMSMGLELPNSLLYDWQENHFKFKASPVTGPPNSTISIEYLEIEEKTKQVEQLISVLRTLLPEFLLLPPVPQRTEALRALHQNMTREKPALFRFIYGDPEMPREKYIELRRGSKFKDLDAKIDGPRTLQALENFDFLMKVRERTKDVRSGIQKIISSVVNGSQTLEDAKKDLELHQQELLSYLPGRHSTSVDVGLASVGFAVTMAEVLGTLSGTLPIAVSPVGPGITAYGFWRARAQRHHYQAIRQQYPLAWFLRDFKEIQSEETRKLMRRHRAKKD